MLFVSVFFSCFFARAMCNFATVFVGVLACDLLKRDDWFDNCLCLFGYSFFCIQLSVIIVLRLQTDFVNLLVFFLVCFVSVGVLLLLNYCCVWRE